MNHQNKTAEKKVEDPNTTTDDCSENCNCGPDCKCGPDCECGPDCDSENNKAETEANPVEEVVDYQEKYLRLYAEFDNFRKRSMRERVDLIRTASQDVIETMLPLLDDFARAKENGNDDVKVIMEGMALIHTKLESTLASKGLKLMEVKSGDDFNVDFHEAITNIPAPTPKLKGKIVDVVENGYILGDKVLRYAKVVIGQ
jgi:molecular chaperone GrpE